MPLSVRLRHLDDDYMGEHWLATFAVPALAVPHHERPSRHLGASSPA